MNPGSPGIPPSSNSSENTWPIPHLQAPMPAPQISHPRDAPLPLASDNELDSFLAAMDNPDNPENPEVVNLYGPEQLSITVGPQQEQDEQNAFLSTVEARYQDFIRAESIQRQMDLPVPSNCEGTNGNENSDVGFNLREAAAEHPLRDNLQYPDPTISEVDNPSDEEFVSNIAEAIKNMDKATKNKAKTKIDDIICKAHSGEL